MVSNRTLDYLVVGGFLAGVAAITIVLPLSLLQSGLLAAAVVLVGGVAVIPGAWPTLYRRTGVGPGAWLLAVSLAAGGISLSYLVGNPQPFCDGIGYRGCLTPYGYASMIYTGSMLGAAIAVGHLGRYRRLRNAALSPASEVDEGLVAVEGRIVPAAATVAGPVSGEPTVWYRSVVETPALFTSYLERDHETGGDEFYVQDGSGRILVSPAHIDAHDAAEHAHTTTEDGDDHRRREWSFRPETPVVVVGHATAVSRADYPEPVVVGLSEPVLIGTQSLDDLKQWAARRTVVGGVLTLGVGGLALLAMLLTA